MNISEGKPSISISQTDNKYQKFCKCRDALRVSGKFNVSNHLRNELYSVTTSEEENVIIAKYVNILIEK